MLETLQGERMQDDVSDLQNQLDPWLWLMF